ncbi:MAG TPA: DUF4286 family protein [Agriterribacter sp.]|nr:DUF4286 family protein [Agriterribacter sp.]
MIVYNITIKIHPAIETAWIRWQKEVHIPEILETGMFDDYKIYRLLELDDADGLTFTIQYFATSWQSYQQYIADFADIFRKKAIDKWGNQFIAFRTVMELVN